MEQTVSETTTIGNASAALALADSSSASPQTSETPSVETPAAAIAQPDTPSDPAATDSTKAKGEPPAWRWQDILENARKTTAQETEARIRQEAEQQYGWAKGITEAERQGLLTWRAAMHGDPQALAHLKANPQVTTWVKGLVEQAAPAASDPEPEPDLQTADGTPVFSAPQLRKWREWDGRRQDAKTQELLRKELAPFQTVAQTFQQREAQATFTNDVSGVLAKMKAADPTFEARMKDVGAVLQADQGLMQLALTNPALAIELADARVYRTKVVPQQQKVSEAQVLSTLQQRAVAATTNPATATSGTPVNTLGDARAALAQATAQLGG